ncbi:MAG: L-threonylcarbamoyladenylate synthase [Candidatus Magasanikbacteria bacterium]
MEIIKEDKVDIEKLKSELEQGKTLAYPTETCYGLGCLANIPEAVEKVFGIKKRDKNKAVLVLVPDQTTAKEYLKWNSTLQRLTDKFWPGDLTVVSDLKSNMGLSKLVTSDGTLAVRVSSSPTAKKITEAVDHPLVSTSANISGSSSPYSGTEVKNIYENKDKKPDIIIDGGELDPKPSSTIVKVNGDISVIREGAVEVSQIKEFL